MIVFIIFFVSSRRRHTRCALVTGVQTCALPICLNPLPIGVRTEAVVERGAVEAVPMRDLDRVNPGVIECLCDLANMIDAVLMEDRMHAFAQRHVLNVEFGSGWIERHHAASFCKRRAAIFSAVESAAAVIMSRLTAYAGR